MKLSPLNETTPPLCPLELEKTAVDRLEEAFLVVATHCLFPLVVFTSRPTNVDLEDVELTSKLTPSSAFEVLSFPPCFCVVEFNAAVHTLFFDILVCIFFADIERG